MAHPSLWGGRRGEAVSERERALDREVAWWPPCCCPQAASKQHRDAWRRAALVGAQLRPGRPRWFASLHQLLLRAGFLASDHAHHGLMLLVFGFKVRRC